MTKFVYMLNALEGAAQAENPAIAGYSGRRVAILDYVQGLEAENAKLREEQANLEHDISSYVEIDAEHHATNDALRARVAELEGVIAEHNKRCERECEDTRWTHVSAETGRHHSCPRRYMIEVGK